MQPWWLHVIFEPWIYTCIQNYFLRIAIDVFQRLKGDGFSVFHRTRKAEFEHFTLEQKRIIDIAILGVERLLQAKIGQTFGVEEYLSLN